MSTPSADTSSNAAATVFHVAWMAILLGCLLELVHLTIINMYTDVQSVKPFIADLVQKIAWAGIVCVGLAIGTAASKLKGVTMGLLGLLQAPIAFLVARALHRGASHSLGLPDLPQLKVDPLVVGLIKGAEYAMLGLVIGWLGKRSLGGFFIYVGSGLVAGILFGGLIFYLLDPRWPVPGMSIAANELIFPVGCSVVLFVAESLVPKAATAVTTTYPTRSRETQRAPFAVRREEPKP